MQFQSNKPSVQFTTVIAKIDQLLRLYQMCKKTDTSKKLVVQKKVNDLLNSIRGDTYFSKVQQFMNKKIQIALDDVKIVNKVQRQISNVSSIKSGNQSQDKVIISDASISGNNITSSEQKSKNKFPLQNKPSIQTQQIQSSSSINNSQSQSPSAPSNQGSSSQISNDKSQDNGLVLLLDNLLSIYHQYAGHVQDMLAFNEDIFTTLKQTQDNKLVYLFGINNPQKKNIKKLYICTLMKFSIYEVLNSLDNNNESKFIKQAKMFENNLRTPIGLIMCGKGIQDIGVEYLRFLSDMKSSLGVIILLQSFKDKNGIMIEFSGQSLKMSRQLNKVQYAQKSIDIRKQYAGSIKDISKIQVVKDKLVITKNLARAITQSIQSAQNAIQIQSSNECIKQQPNRFPYKLHTKYYVSSKSDYQLFFLDNQLVAFKMNYKQKQFDQFRKYVLQQAHHKGNYLMSTSVLKQNSQIKKQFWRLLVQCKTRDDYFLINLSGITNKKTIILSLKQGISQDMIMNAEPFLFKDLQKPTQIINVVAVITKQNYKQFETQNKQQVIDLTQKKK